MSYFPICFFKKTTGRGSGRGGNVSSPDLKVPSSCASPEFGGAVIAQFPSPRSTVQYRVAIIAPPALTKFLF